MSRAARVQDGFLSSLMRERTRARRGARSNPRSGEPLVPETSTHPSTALLVMDMQNAVVERFAAAGVLERAVAAAAAARAHGVPVIFARVAFRPGHPEVSPRNRAFAALAGSDAFADEHGTAIHPALAPAPDEVVVTKRRVSAFAGSDLDMVLRAQQIDHLVISGISTSGVVLSTMRQAADLDFRLTVLADGCTDGDAEVHRVLMEKVFSRQSEVVTIEQWIDSLNGRS